MRLKGHTQKSTVIDSYGFIGEGRGRLRIQFKDKDGNLTALGDYVDVPEALMKSFEVSRAPGAFLDKQVKPYFKWEPVATGDDKTVSSMESDEGIGCGCIDGKDGGKW